MCHIWDIWYLTNIFCPSGHWSGLVTMIQVNSLPVHIVVCGADTTFHIKRLFTPGQQPARCSIYRAIVICEMSDPWPDMMTKFIISPVKSSTDNRLLRGVIREGCLAVAWDTVISPSPLTGLRILCNQIYNFTNLELGSPMKFNIYWSIFRQLFFFVCNQLG